jgi:hypothetical protein
MADCTERFMARRNATRRSSCWAIDSATSVASISGLRTSTMLMTTSILVIFETLLRSLSMSAPFLPITTPGRAEWMVTRHFLCGRSMTIFDTAACFSCFIRTLADLDVLVQQLAVFAVGEPARIPGAVDAEAQPDRIDLLTHYAFSSTWRTTMVRFENALMIARPAAARGLEALHHDRLADIGLG